MYIHVADRTIVFPRRFSQLFTLLRITTVSPLIVCRISVYDSQDRRRFPVIDVRRCSGSGQHDPIQAHLPLPPVHLG